MFCFAKINGDIYLEDDDVLRLVIQQEQQARIRRHVNNCLVHPGNDRQRSAIRDVFKYFIRA